MMKKQLLTCLFILSAMIAYSQPNLIVNPDFELGSTPTNLGQISTATGWTQPCTDGFMYSGFGAGADVLDRSSSNTDVKVPVNHWTFEMDLEERDGDNRYAHLFQIEQTGAGNGGSNVTKGERISGTLTETLGEGCYEFCFRGAVVPEDNSFLPGVFFDSNPMNTFDLSKQRIEVLLVNGNQCDGKLIYTSPAIPDDGIWHKYCSNVDISDVEAGSYNRILFRIKDDGNADINLYSIFLDEVELVNNTPSINISGTTDFCVGSSTTLTADAGYDNYLWSNGSTTISTSVNASGTYTVTAWNDGSDCKAIGTITVNAIPLPVIKLPENILVCNELFTGICAPPASILYTYDYSWYFNDPVTMTSILISNVECIIPSEYGSYTLVMTNQYGCTSSHTVNVVEAFGPELNLKDVYYCEISPAYLGFPGAFADAVSYSWTFDDGSGPVVVPGANSHQIPNMGDGEYCLTIEWGSISDKESNLNGCTSYACFKVEQCCPPNTAFILNYDPTGASATITVQNNPLNIVDYDSERFVLYQYCGTSTDLGTIPWTQIAATPWNTDFTTPVVFPGLDDNCIYKVVHQVNKNCKQKVYVSQQLAGLLKIGIYPNPVKRDRLLRVEMTFETPQATVEIRSLVTGELTYKGTLNFNEPLNLHRNTFARRAGIYVLKVSNEMGSITEKIIVE